MRSLTSIVVGNMLQIAFNSWHYLYMDLWFVLWLYIQVAHTSDHIADVALVFA